MSKSLKVMAILLVLIVGFYAQDLFSWLSKPVETSLTDHCQLSTQQCQQDGVTITMSKDSAQPFTPVTLTVKWPKTQADQLTLNLQGYEMDMGQARFALMPTADGQYSGEILLPACTMETMTWIGELNDGAHSIDVAIRMKQ